MKRIFAILFSLAFAFNVYAADIKISELPVVTSVTPATDVVPVVASGATSQVTVTNLMKGANAGTATALAANPTDCGALGLATAIDASGNLTCGYAIGTDVQAYDADLTTIAGLTVAQGKFIIGSSSPAWSASAYTLPTAVCTSGYLLKSDGTNMVCSNSLSVTIDDSAAQFTSATASKGTRKLVQSSIDNGILLTDTPVITGNVTWTNISQGAGTYTRVFEEALNVFTVKQEFDATAGLQVGSTGVLITSDNDGAITFLGASGGYDEDLTLNLDDTENTAVISSSTGVTKVDFSALNLATTGTINGAIKVEKDDDTLAASQCYGTFHWYSGGAETITLPAAVVGMNLCVYASDATVKNIDPNGTDTIVLTTAALAAGYQIKSSGAAGDFICLVSFTANQWTAVGRSGVWVTHGAD